MFIAKGTKETEEAANDMRQNNSIDKNQHRVHSHSSYNTNKHGNRNSPQTLVERARSLERSLSVPSFVPSKVQVLKPFDVILSIPRCTPLP